MHHQWKLFSLIAFQTRSLLMFRMISFDSSKNIKYTKNFSLNIQRRSTTTTLCVCNVWKQRQKYLNGKINTKRSLQRYQITRIPSLCLITLGGCWEVLQRRFTSWNVCVEQHKSCKYLGSERISIEADVAGSVFNAHLICFNLRLTDIELLAMLLMALRNGRLLRA